MAIKSADTVKEYMENIVSNLVKTEGKLEFHLKGTDNAFSFVPHYSQYKESYAIYWTYSVDEGARGSEAIISEKNAVRVQDAVLEGARGTVRMSLGLKRPAQNPREAQIPAGDMPMPEAAFNTISR